MEEKYIAAVDLGTGKTALTVAKVTGEDIAIVYYRQLPSDGIRNSAVFNPKKAEEPLRQLIREAEDELKIKIMQVVVGLPRCDVHQEVAEAKVSRTNPDESITREEVENLKTIAQDEYPLDDADKQVLYGAVAQSFSADEDFQLLENDIIGVISSTFEGNFKLFIGKKSSVRYIDKTFNDLGIAIARKYFTPDVQARAILTEDEMNGGVALVDLGAGATSVTIYQGKILRHYAAIPFGGETVTTDITTECGISRRLAENIKYAYGACMPEKLQTLGEKTLQIEGSELESVQQIPVKYLSEIITARIKEIMDAVLYEIQCSGLAASLRNGMVITGGGARLANISAYVKEISGYSVRIGRPRNKVSAAGCPGIFEPASSTSVGLILSAKEDGLSGCIDPVETPSTPGLSVILPEDGTDAAAVAETMPQETGETVPDTGTALPEDAEEGTGSMLFGEEEVPEDSEKKKKKPKQPKEPKKPGRIGITWRKFIKMVDNVTSEMS